MFQKALPLHSECQLQFLPQLAAAEVDGVALEAVSAEGRGCAVGGAPAGRRHGDG